MAPSLAPANDFKLAIDSELGRRLSNLPENSWVRLNLNEFQNVWTPLDQRPRPPDAPSVGNPGRVISAWSSMAWDSKRGQLLFWGGGHANYPGNEVYRWSAPSLMWERGSLPSEVMHPPTNGGIYEAVDGPYNAPTAAHTYDNSEYLPLSDRFITFGGAAFNTGRYFELADGRRTGPFMWDPSRAGSNAVGGTQGSQVKPETYTTVTGGQMWQNRDNLHPAQGESKPGFGGTYWIYGTTAYAQETGKDVLYIQNGSNLHRYTVHNLADPLQDTYEFIGRYITQPIGGQGAGAFDPVKRIFVRTANQAFTYWSVATPGLSNENRIFSPVVESGTFPLDQLKNHGMDFDPVRRSFLLWRGEREVWRLTAPEDLVSGQWLLTPLNPTSAAAPSFLANATTANSDILGKWKYAAALDVFLGAFDATRGQVWAYKPAQWRPQVVVPLPYLVAPAAGSSHGLDSSIQFVADSVDKTVNYVRVFVDGVPVGTGSAVPYATTWQPTEIGSYTITVRAMGADGVERESPPVTIQVANLSNVPPTVALTSPTAGQSFTQGAAIGITASASDSDGTVSRVDFYAGTSKVGEDSTAPYSFSWSGAALGDHTLTAVAFDNSGASTTSAAIVVSVVAPPPNVPPTVSLTSPAGGANIIEGTSIGLAASASDSDGTVARVDFYAGTTKLGEDSTAPYSFSWSGAALGSHTLTAVAFDNSGASTTSAAVVVSVVPGGGSEVVATLQDGLNGYAGTRDTYLYEYQKAGNFGGQQYLLDQRTGQRLRSLVKFAIFQSEGGPVPDGATIVSARLSLYKYSQYDQSYELRPLLVPWEERQASWNESRTGTPWASGGASMPGSDTGPFDATGATAWSAGWVDFDVTAGVQAMGQGRANHGWLMVGTSGNSNLKRYYSREYTTDTTQRPKLLLRYLDGSGNQLPTVALTSPANGSSHDQGAAIEIAATADDADGTVTRVEFYAGATKIGEDTTAPYAISWGGAPAGSHSLTAVAFDNGGASKTSTAVGITVVSNVPNVPPTAALTSPAAGQSFTQGATIGLTASASDSDGTVSRVEFYAGATKIGEDSTAPYSFSWSGAALGDHTLTAVAFDNSGASTTSAQVVVSVVAPPPNVPPTVALTAPSDGSSTAQGGVIGLAATAGDSDGTVGRVEFYAGTTKLGEDSTAPYSFSWSGAALGSHTLTAVAFDNSGASTTSAAVVVTVVPGGTDVVVTLQDGLNGYAGTRDTYLYEYQKAGNFGGQQYLLDQRTGQRLRSLVKFAIFQSEGGPVPDGATIVSARLSLYKYSQYDHNYELRPLLVPWEERQASWNESRTGAPWASGGASTPGSDTGPFDATGVTAWSAGWVEFDVTAGLQAVAQGRANHGWLMMGITGNTNIKRYYSREYTTKTSQRPKLVISYR